MVSETTPLVSHDTTKDIKVSTPLPKAQMTILLVCLFADSLSITVVYPLAPYLVQDFFHFDSQHQSSIGYYAGLIAAAYTIGQIVGSPFWGTLSDRIGRRPVILAGMIGNIIFLILFGCATTFYSALGLRFAQGLSSGNVPVIKAYIADITDDTNESKAFSYIAVVFGLGISIGPSLGGMLAHPAVHYPNVFSSTSIFGSNPYLLPLLVIAIKVTIDFIFAVFLLPESCHKDETDLEIAEKTLPNTPRGILNELESSVATPSGPDFSTLEKESRRVGMRVILKCSNFRKACLLQVLTGLCIFGFWEVLPVWARGSRELGGIGFGPADVGVLQSAAGMFILFCSVFLYSKLCDSFGYVRLYRIGVGVLLFAIPIPILLSTLEYTKDQSLTWLLLLFAMLCYSLGSNLCFTTFTIMLKASVPKKHVGLGMSIGQSVSNCGYALGPILGGTMFSYVLSLGQEIPSPFGSGRLYFFLLEMILVVALSCTALFSPWPWTAPQTISP